MDALHISQVPAIPVPIDICPIADGYCTAPNQQEEWPENNRNTQIHVMRIAMHFVTKKFSWSTMSKSKTKEKAKLYNTPTMSSFYNPVGVSTSRLPSINKNMESLSTSPQRWQTRCRILNCTIFPDHPG
jgi:hypothetical protein